MNQDFLKLKSAVRASALVIVAAAVGCTTPDATILVDASKVEQQITPWLYGACMEDVNHEIYGGLYDQKIFGESFEEPVPSPAFDDFTEYDGIWETSGGILRVAAHSGAKLVYDRLEQIAGPVSVELKFMHGGSGDNAGLLLSVSQPGRGADNFYGYEISLVADGSKVILGKHKHNFTLLAEAVVGCDAAKWNRLGALLDGDGVKIFLNGACVLTAKDDDPELKAGKIALRTWNSDVQFRNIKIGNAAPLAFRTTPAVQVSRQWDAVGMVDNKSSYRHVADGAYNGSYSQQIELLAGVGKAGIANMGLNRWGIAVRKGQNFEGRLYLKGAVKGAVTIALESADGAKIHALTQLTGITGGWQKFPFRLISDADDPKARFAVYLNKPGRLQVDQVTLMTTGDDQFNGLPLRNDIGQAMVDQGLTFLRYGGTMINTEGYRFKKMIGDRDKRPPYTGHWYRWSTNGFGIEDFLQFCEAAGFEPSFAVNIEETPEDMADMIEYLNGPATSVWGRKRAENGHPEPYHVKYIGIGNEEVLFHGDRADEYDHYIERFNLLHDAMKAKDPSISLVCTAWWRPDSPSIEKVFRAMDGKADYWDYHPWADQLTSGSDVMAELRQMQQMFLGWNPATTLKCAIFEENGNSHNIQRVLGHVTLQNAVRRMGDFVLTSCAANALQPYGQNDNGWDQGQVFFTPTQVWGMPPYYAQQMAAANHQPLLVASRTQSPADALDVTATRSEDNRRLVLHIANTSGGTVNTRLQVDGLGTIADVRAVSLSGALDDVNTPDEPERITPRERPLKPAAKQTIVIAPYSYTIVVLSAE